MNRSIEKMIGMVGLRTGAVLYAMLFAGFGAFVVPKALAQTVAVAEVAGYVTDPTGSAVPGAQVTMTEIGKNQTHTTTSDSQGGRYSFPNLDIGTYKLTVSREGFSSYVQSGIVLQVASNININVQLEVGAVTQTVEVYKSDSTMIETKDNSIAQVIDSRRVVDLPLNGRNPTQLILLTGAATAPPTNTIFQDLITSKNIGGSNGSGTFSIAGGQANGVNYLLDGGDNNDPIFNVNLPLPFPDAIQEFSVQTSSLPAQYGLHPGGVVNAVTKSGANAFHGEVFEFLRNGAMDAVQDGTPARDSLKRSQFGGAIGGRIIRDELFFFAGYQGTRQRSTPPSAISYVATAAALRGDFSTLAAGKKLINPVTKAPFTNNQIPVSMFDPAAVVLLTKYLPISSDPSGKVQYGFLANNPDDQVIGRLDYTLNQKHSMYARYYIYDFTAQTVFDGSNLLTTASPGQVQRTQTFTFGDSYIFSPTTLNSFHATFNRRRNNRGVAANVINPTTLGVNMTAPIPNFLQITTLNYFNVGCTTCSPGHFNGNTYQVSDDVILIRGKHEIGFGGDFRRLQGNLLANTSTNGSFSFSGSYTGDSLADLLLGDMASFSQGNPQPDALRQSVMSFYAQDTFHAAKRLTLNFGLRWEPAQFPYDKFGRTPQFSQTAFNAGTVSKIYPTAPAGLVFPGDIGSYQGKSQVKSYWLDVSPRIGLIYDPRGDGKQSIRAGFGLMHDTGMLYYPERWTYSPPFASLITLTNPVGDSFSNPWAGQPGGNPFPGASFFPIGGSYYIIPTDMKPTYEMQWNLNIQQKLAQDWLAQVGYLGTRSVHVWSAYDINPSVYIQGSTASANKRRLLYLQNPAAGQYYGGIYSGDPGGHGQYDALLLTLKHGFAKHFQMTSNYTWSRCISDADLTGEVAGTSRENPYSLSFERGNCYFDVTNSFNLSGVATVPNLGGGITRMLVRNWQFSPIVTWRSGNVLNITDGGVDISGTAQGNDRPNQVLANPYPATKTTSQWFTPAAFARQAAGTFGNVQRNSLRGPGAFNMDLSLSREFHVEKVGFMFRVDGFNALNHPVWGNPTTSITSAQFGKITTYGQPRILQVGAKVMF